MKRLKISLTDKTLDGLLKESALRGVTPNVLIRICLAEQFAGEVSEDKTFLVRFENREEIVAYAAAKGFGAEKFIVDAVGRDMRRNALKPLQKAYFEELLKK